MSAPGTVPDPPLPEPFVPADADLRGVTFMPLMGERLFKSATWIQASPRAQVAALRLWWHAFAHEVPAGSLPDDERLLAAHAALPTAAFRTVREQAMRGWVKCSDGRLYHKVVAELALDAWEGRIRGREKMRKWRGRKAPVTGNEPVRDRSESKVQVQEQVQSQSESAAADSGTAAEAAAVDRAFALWQEAAAREGWPEVMFLNSTRRWKLAQRLAEAGGLDGWQAALAATARAEFLKQPDGRFHRWFDLDWLLDEQKFTRLMEGRYDQRHRTVPAAAAQGSGLDAALAELGRAGAAAGRAG